jgi:hypothetical protein
MFMKFKQIILTPIVFLFVAVTIQPLFGQRKKAIETVEKIELNKDGKGVELKLMASVGPSHNYPMMAAWIEDLDGNYIQTIYVNESVAKGYFDYAVPGRGKWEAGYTVRPASLPVWSHSRGVQSDEGHFMPTNENPIPDAYTSATPKSSFLLETKTDEVFTGKVKVFFEINQSWDWNDHWTNNKFPEDEEYKSSAQPSVVYSATIETNKPGIYELTAAGHGHPSGSDGKINPDISTLSTALEIVSSVTVEVK